MQRSWGSGRPGWPECNSDITPIRAANNISPLLPTAPQCTDKELVLQNDLQALGLGKRETFREKKWSQGAVVELLQDIESYLLKSMKQRKTFSMMLITATVVPTIATRMNLKPDVSLPSLTSNAYKPLKTRVLCWRSTLKSCFFSRKFQVHHLSFTGAFKHNGSFGIPLIEKSWFAIGAWIVSCCVQLDRSVHHVISMR